MGLIVVTGAAGFIGSCLVTGLLGKGFSGIVAVDDFSKREKDNNLSGKDIAEKIDRKDFFNWLNQNAEKVDFIYHIGARTDTTEFNMAIFDELNTGYSMNVWKLASTYKIPMVYASSAATYGLGEYGYFDNHDIVESLQPLNPYGISKNEFDKWALKQISSPPFWAGMKFFNVYGPNEYHKGRMASVIFHAYRQINETGKVKLFRSHRPDFEDGKQLRDFVYVRDVVSVLIFMMEQRPAHGLYNLGTGVARSFSDLAKASFHAMGMPPVIEFVDTPADIRDKYQYFTEADITKLRHAGYQATFTSLEDGVSEYISDFISKKKYL